MTPLDIVNDEIKSREKLISDAYASIEVEKHRIHELQLELGTLHHLRQRIESAPPEPAQSSNGNAPTVPTAPTEAIRALLHERPRTTTEIADELVGRMATTSKNPRRLLYSLLGQMREKGEVERDENGVNRLVER